MLRAPPLLRRLGPLLAALALGPAAAATTTGEPRCARRPVVHAATGTPVHGIEDLAVDRARGRLYLSAYDRTALDEAVNRGSRRLPQGAIYAVALSALAPGNGAAGALAARPAVSPGEVGGDLHPHGIALRPDGGLAAINRAYRRGPDGGWARETRIELFDAAGNGLAHRRSLADPALCRANDLVAHGPGTLLVTRDHGACATAGRWLEDVLGLSRGKLLRVRTEGGRVRIAAVARGLTYPNGIAATADGALIPVAETRAQRLALFDADDLGRATGPARPVRTHALPGGPDNISVAPDGTLLVALHPRLWHFALARYRILGRRDTASRVVRVDPRSGRIRTVIDDPEGARLSGATAAVAAGGLVIASSVIDDALLVCRR